MPLQLSDRELLLQIHSAIFGDENLGGLLRKVDSNGKRIWRIELVIAVLISSGLLGGGTAAVLRLL